MGYCVEIITWNITIPADKVADCLAAINALHTDTELLAHASGGSWGGGVSMEKPLRERKWYSWVDNPKDGEGFKDIRDAFTAWRYEPIQEEDGSVSVDSFHGEKWGDDPILYAAIAPFVLQEAGNEAIIECRGEDGNHWRYLFKDGGMVEQSAKVSWE